MSLDHIASPLKKNIIIIFIQYLYLSLIFLIQRNKYARDQMKLNY